MQGVYIVKHPLYPNVYKIGCSINISNRLLSLSTMFFTEDKLKLNYAIFGEFYMNIEGVLELEKEIHRYFNSRRICKERELFKFEEHELKNELDEMIDLFDKNKNRILEISSNYIKQDIISNAVDSNREYQKIIIDKTIKHFETKNIAYIFGAPGFGKTYITGYIIQKMGLKKVLIITPQKLICDEFIIMCKTIGLDDFLIVNSDYKNTFQNSKIITTYQSSLLEGVDKLNETDYDMIIYDEGHHAFSPQNKKLLNIKSKYKIICTATPKIEKYKKDNDDSDDEIENSFETELEIKIDDEENIIVKPNIDENIKDGILCDYSLYIHDGPEALKDIIEIANEMHIRKRIIVFFNTRENAKNAYNMFNLDENQYEKFYVDGETKQIERDKIVNKMREIPDYKEGKCLIVFNVNIIAEGVSILPIDCIIFAEKRGSSIGLMQNTGRGLRTSPGKNNCMIIIPECIENMIEDVMKTLYHSGSKNIRKRLTGNTKTIVRKTLEFSDRICNIRKMKSFDEWINLMKEYEKTGEKIISSTIYKGYKIGSKFNNVKKKWTKNKLTDEEKDFWRKLISFNLWENNEKKEKKEKTRDEWFNLILEYENSGEKITNYTIYKGEKIGSKFGKIKQNWTKLNDEEKDFWKQLNCIDEWEKKEKKEKKTRDEWFNLILECENSGEKITNYTIYKGEKIGIKFGDIKQNWNKNKLNDEEKDFWRQLNCIDEWEKKEKKEKTKEKTRDEWFNLILECENSGEKITHSTNHIGYKIGNKFNHIKENWNKNKLNDEEKDFWRQLKCIDEWENSEKKERIQPKTKSDWFDLFLDCENNGIKIIQSTNYKGYKIGNKFNNIKNRWNKNKLTDEEKDFWKQLKCFNEWLKKH